MATEPADNITLTRAQKRQITVAEREEKARQEQKAFEAQSKTSGGRQAKLDAKKNAIWNVDKPASRKRTSSTVKVSDKAKKPREAGAPAQSDAEDDDEPQAKATAAKRKFAAPVIAINSDSDDGSDKAASMTSTKSSLKLLKSKAVGKVKAVAKKALKKVTNAGKTVTAKVSSKTPGPAKIIAESASEVEARDSPDAANTAHPDAAH